MLVLSVKRTCVSTRLLSRTMKVSASRLMTTPLNFIFAPLGTGRMFAVGSFVVWPLEPCPKTSGVPASTKPRPQTRRSDRDILISLMLILKLHQHRLRNAVEHPEDLAIFEVI